MNYKTILPLTAAALAMSAGLAVAQGDLGQCERSPAAPRSRACARGPGKLLASPGPGLLLLGRGGIGAGRQQRPRGL
jgi:hypothetical protein